jgi:hypothetical protein
MNVDDILASFKRAYPNDSIVIYKFKNGRASSFLGERLLKIKLDNGYFLQIVKLSTSSGGHMSSDEIKAKAFAFVYESKHEKDDVKRRDLLRDKFKVLFPDHLVNVFLFSDSDWGRYANNIKGGTFFEKDYGSEVDVVLN